CCQQKPQDSDSPQPVHDVHGVANAADSDRLGKLVRWQLVSLLRNGFAVLSRPRLWRTGLGLRTDLLPQIRRCEQNECESESKKRSAQKSHQVPPCSKRTLRQS